MAVHAASSLLPPFRQLLPRPAPQTMLLVRIRQTQTTWVHATSTPWHALSNRVLSDLGASNARTQGSSVRVQIRRTTCAQSEEAQAGGPRS